MSSKSPATDLQKDAETLFRAMDGLDQILSPDAAGVKKPGFHEIYAYVFHPTTPISDALAHALKTDLNVRRDIRNLLARAHPVDIGKAIAASSGDIVEREAEGFKLILKPSQSQKDQLYLIIRALDRDEVAKFLFIETEEGFYRLEIEDFYDREAQILLPQDHEIVKALHNPKSHVILSL